VPTSQPPRGPRRRLAWRSDPPRRDLRDQLGLRSGWVRLWLRAMLLGFGLCLIAVSLGRWAALQILVPPLFLVGLLLIPVGALLALITWSVPLPIEVPVRCPRCGAPERVLRLPWRFEFICRGCQRHGHIQGGELDLP
jgi:hypothetical protein